MTSTPASAPTEAPATGARNPDPLAYVVGETSKWFWDKAKKIAGYTRGLIEGVFVAGGALAGIDVRGGPGIIERVEHTRAFVEKAVGKAAGFTAGLPVRILEHPLKAGRILWNALWGRSVGGGGHAAATHAEPAPAHG